MQSIMSREKGMCKGPEVGMGSWTSREARVAGLG